MFCMYRRVFWACLSRCVFLSGITFAAMLTHVCLQWHLWRAENGCARHVSLTPSSPQRQPPSTHVHAQTHTFPSFSLYPAATGEKCSSVEVRELALQVENMQHVLEWNFNLQQFQLFQQLQFCISAVQHAKMLPFRAAVFLPHQLWLWSVYKGKGSNPKI